MCLSEPDHTSEDRSASSTARLLIILILGLFILLAGTYSVVVPPFETPDEIWHFAFIQHLAEGNGLPVSEPQTQARWQQQGVQAPAYYLVAAALTTAIDQSDFPSLYDRANPHRAIGQPDADDNRNYLIHYPRQEAWPWKGSILALHLARFFSVLLGAVTIYATYRSLLLLVPLAWAILGSAFLAFIPQFVFISGAASNDNGVNAAAAVVLWILLEMVLASDHERRPASEASQNPGLSQPVSDSKLLSLGIGLGIALTTKLSAIALVGLAGLTILGLAWRRKSFRLLWRACCWTGLPALLISGWWYVRNWQLYEDPLAWNIWRANILLRVTPADWSTIWTELESLERSFWGLFGWMNVGYPAEVYWALRLFELVLLLGFLSWLARQALWLRKVSRDPLSNRRLWAGGLLILWLILLCVSWLRFMQIAPAAQGRYFFPAAPALALIYILSCIGLAGHGKVGKWLGAAAVGCLMGLAILTPFWIIRPAYEPPPMPVEEIEPQYLGTFGQQQPQIALVASSVGPDQLWPGGQARMDLTWQALGPLAPDYSVFIHLEDDAGLTVAQLDTMPGGGLRPTSRWQKGAVLRESYLIDVPNTAYTPNQGEWTIGLYDHRTGQRLPRFDQDGDSYRFGAATMGRPSSTGWPNAMNARFADNVSLVGYEFSQRLLQTGQTVTVTLYWQTRGPVEHDYTTFVHILDQDLTMHGGHDSVPLTPTTAWQAGSTIEDVHKFQLSPTAPSGRYQFEVGLYTQPDFRRLRLIDADGAEGADRLLLGPVRVEQ